MLNNTMNKDSNLIYENYETSILLEGLIIDEILREIKHGMDKDGLVHIMKLIKGRSEYYYNSLIKNIREYIKTGTTGITKYDKIAEYIILIIKNLRSEKKK